jgi:mxaA protein
MRQVVCLFGLLISMPAGAQIRSVTLLPPDRILGLLVGDTLAATATIAVGPGTTLDAASLPAPGPVAPSIDIRGVGVAVENGADASRYTIRVTYQNFATPDHVGSVDVPPYTLAFRQSGKRLAAQIPGFSFTASPIQNANAVVVDASSLQPDHATVLMDTAGPSRIAAAGCAIAILAACALAALLGLVPWPPRRAGPFAAAQRAIKRGVASDRAAFLLLHRAFDETAGMRVFAEDLESFFVRHTRFSTLRGDIETFFAASRTLFFGAPDNAAPARLEHLARDLTRAERRR